MMTQTQLRVYAETLHNTSEFGSLEEKAAERIIDLLDHGHDPESILVCLEKDIQHGKLDEEDTTALESAVQDIENS